MCGYRSPSTNAMLRRRSEGVARYSQHILGRAMDFYVPGISLEQVREIGLRLARGGVGFYPESGSPFVHMDVGGIRMWPRMSREQLCRVFPDGRTVQIPIDGKPLPGYVLALAEVTKRGAIPSANSLRSRAQRRHQCRHAAGEQRSPGRRPILSPSFWAWRKMARRIDADATLIPVSLAPEAGSARRARCEDGEEADAWSRARHGQSRSARSPN